MFLEEGDDGGGGQGVGYEGQGGGGQGEGGGGGGVGGKSEAPRRPDSRWWERRGDRPPLVSHNAEVNIGAKATKCQKSRMIGYASDKGGQ